MIILTALTRKRRLLRVELTNFQSRLVPNVHTAAAPHRSSFDAFKPAECRVIALFFTCRSRSIRLVWWCMWTFGRLMRGLINPTTERLLPFHRLTGSLFARHMFTLYTI